MSGACRSAGRAAEETIASDREQPQSEDKSSSASAWGDGHSGSSSPGSVRRGILTRLRQIVSVTELHPCARTVSNSAICPALETPFSTAKNDKSEICLPDCEVAHVL